MKNIQHKPNFEIYRIFFGQKREISDDFSIKNQQSFFGQSEEKKSNLPYSLLSGIATQHCELLACSVFAVGSALLPASALAFTAGETIPSHVQQIPSGSMADVRSSAVYNDANRTWSVTFRRKLNTGDVVNDILFEAGKTYAFQVASIDNNSGVDSIGELAHVGESSSVFNVTLPSAPGDLTFSAIPNKLSGLSGKLLATSEIEITMSWLDDSKSDALGAWHYSFDKKTKKGSWTLQNLQKDHLAIIWDIQNDNFVSSGNCNQMCHTGTLKMSTASGTKVDSWHWEASTSGPIGHALDQYWDDDIHPDSGRPVYLENDLVNGHPRYQSENHHGGQNATRLFLFPEGMKEAVKPAVFPTEGWKNGNVLPANVVRPPRGGIADVVISSKHDGKQWTVTFRRKLNSGGDSGHDILFEKGKEYAFLYSYHNNSDHDYEEGLDHTKTNPETPFKVLIPTVPGPLTFPVKPSKLNAISGQLLDSDEIEITVSWPDATRNDNKRQWSFDALSSDRPWTRSKPYSAGTAPNIVYASDEERAARTFSSDRFIFVWDMVGDNFKTTGNCQEMCHTNEAAMRTNAGILDSWTWTGSGSPSGYANDGYWDNNGGKGLGDNKSDGGSQSASTGNTGFSPDGKAVVGADTTASTLLYTAKNGAGNSATYLYLDSPQADGWSRGVNSFIQSITKSKIQRKAKTSGKDTLLVEGSYDDGGKGLGLPNAPTSLNLGNALDVVIPSGAFKSKSKGRYLSYTSKVPNLTVKFDTKKKTFQVSATKQNFASLSNSVGLTLTVGEFTGTPAIKLDN